jgi:hypothetical protein
MKLPVIKQLVEDESLDTLRACETALYEEQPTPTTVEGHDEGEKLTHVLAAIWIKEQMVAKGITYQAASREYSKRVRTSITC